MKNRGETEKTSGAADLAIAALVFLAADPERFGRFAALSGIDPSAIRSAAGEPGFLPGVLDHLMGDERLLLDFAAEHGLRPEDVAAARMALAGPPVG